MMIEGCEIEARNISYTIQTPNTTHPFKIWSRELDAEAALEAGGRPTTARARHVLKSVSCRAKPYEILAIVGPSGAGKSTLLEILAGKLTPHTAAATVLVNRVPISGPRFKKLCGYVMQRDLLFPLLTVRETLMFSARLRLGRHQGDLSSRVDSLVQELGLGHVAGARVGASDGKIRGLSGGERRRVSIGVEVVHDPRILILDEPTSGLDSMSALQIVDMLKAMAEKRGRTVILSIHQPGFRIVKLFNSVVVLAEGEVVHQGSVDQLQMHLRSVGLEVPAQVTVLEFAIDSVETLLQLRRRRQQKQCELLEDDGERVSRVSRDGRRDRCTLQQLFQLNKVADEDTVRSVLESFSTIIHQCFLFYFIFSLTEIITKLRLQLRGIWKMLQAFTLTDKTGGDSTEHTTLLRDANFLN